MIRGSFNLDFSELKKQLFRTSILGFSEVFQRSSFVNLVVMKMNLFQYISILEYLFKNILSKRRWKLLEVVKIKYVAVSLCKRIESLREKCPNAKLFLVLIFPHSDWIRRETSYQSECGKMRTRNNSVFGHFSRSDCLIHSPKNLQERSFNDAKYTFLSAW